MSSRPVIPRVALVHDWLTGMRGGEKVLEQLCLMFPSAGLFTLIHARGSCSPAIENRPIRTSWLDDLPAVERYYRRLLALMPLAVERMDLSAYDLIVSTSHCVAKGVTHSPERQLHVCYCFTPMRYVWAVGEEYDTRLGASGLLLRALRPYLRAWDRHSARRVDYFLADSACVARRIAAAYRRTSDVLYPPVDVEFFTPSPEGSAERIGSSKEKEEEEHKEGETQAGSLHYNNGFYLMVSALAPYKRVDQAIEAFAHLRRPLKIIGAGPDMARLRRLAPPNVQLLGWQDAVTLRDHYRRCRAVIFPQIEDFGIVPLEAMSCGAPVIAYGEGGAMETVLDAADPQVAYPTGLLYRPQTADALASAVERFEGMAGRFDGGSQRAWAMRFSPQNFRDGFKRALEPLLQRRNWSQPWE